MKTTFVIMLLALVVPASAQNPPTPIGTVKEGVYFLGGMFQTIIVELKDGQFRFWFSSDMKLSGDLTRYPHTGKYGTNGGEITFVTTNSYVRRGLGGETSYTNHLVQTNRWTFMTHDGKTTLWRPEALKQWKEKRELDGYGILFSTDKKLEEIWHGN